MISKERRREQRRERRRERRARYRPDQTEYSRNGNVITVSPEDYVRDRGIQPLLNIVRRQRQDAQDALTNQEIENFTTTVANNTIPLGRSQARRNMYGIHSIQMENGMYPRNNYPFLDQTNPNPIPISSLIFPDGDIHPIQTSNGLFPSNTTDLTRESPYHDTLTNTTNLRHIQMDDGRYPFFPTAVVDWNPNREDYQPASNADIVPDN